MLLSLVPVAWAEEPATPTSTPEYVAKIGEQGYATLAEAVDAVTENGTITLLKDVSDTGEITLPAGATFDGGNHKVTGASAIRVNAAGGTVKNVQFENIHNSNVVDETTCNKYGWTSKTGNQSAIYASGLTGTLKVEGCTFDNVDWDAIQIAPKTTATIDIENNIFKHTDNSSTQLRYIHIEGTPAVIPNDTVKMIITDNQFFKSANEANQIASIAPFYFKTAEGSNLSGNYVEDISTIVTGYGVPLDKYYPMRSSANDDNDDLTLPDYVASNGQYSSKKIEYLTIAEAIADAKKTVAAGKNATIKLLDNVTGNIDLSTFTGSNKVTLDLNNKTLAGDITANNETVVTAISGGNYSKVNGSIRNSGTAELQITTSGTVTGSVTKTGSGNIVISSGTYSQKPDESFIKTFYIVKQTEGGQWKVSKMNDADAAANGYAVRGGTKSDVIYYNTFAEAAAVADNLSLVLLKDVNEVNATTQSDSKYNTKFTVGLNGHKFSGELTSTKIGVFVDGKNVDGSEAVFSKLTVPAGKPISVANKAIVTLTNAEGIGDINVGHLKNEDSAKLTITGGTYSGTITVNNGATLTITGGTFSVDPSAYVAAGYEVANAGGTYTVKLKDEAKVAAIDEQGYPTLAEAVAAANGKTVKLLKGVTEAITIPAGKTITLDLNGHKLVNSATAQDKDVADASRKHTITNNGTLTILDSVGNGVVDNVSHGRAAIYNAGTITEIKGGKFTRSVDNSTDATSAKGNSWYVVYNAEKATVNSISDGEFLAVGKFSSLFCNCGTIGEISGGTFKQDGFIAFKNEGTVNKISGGTFASENESCIQNWGTIGEITGGTITAGSIGIWNFSSDKYESVGKVGKISGGNISGSTAAIRLNDYDATYLNKPSTTNKASVAVSGGNISGNLQINANTEFSVTGGTFSVNPIDYVQKGYAVTKVKDNEFTVAPVKDTAAVEVTNNSDAGKTSVTIDTITPDNASGGDTNTIDISSLDTGKPTNEIKVNESQLNQIMNSTATKPVEFKLSSKLSVTFSAAAAQNIASQSGFTGEIILTVTPNATVTGTELTAKNSVANAKSQVVTITLTGGASGATPAELYAAATAKGKVTITVPFDMTGYNRLNVYYLDPTTGKAVHVGRAAYDTNAGTATFDVEHFSSYVLVPGKSSSGGGSSSGSGSVGSGTHTVTSDLTGTITKVTVDGKTVASKHYTISGGNVTFTEAFMKTLSNGTHKVTIETATKIARGTFTVDNGTKPVVSSKTGDAGIALYAGMAIASVMGGGLVLTSRKRRSH